MTTLSPSRPRDQASRERPAAPHRGATRRIPRSWLTRILHLALLLAVVHQLVGSEFMRRPFPGDPPGTIYALHQYVGLASLGVVAAFWVWTLLRWGETRLGRLLPWFSAARLRDVADDVVEQLRRVLRGRLPDDSADALASAIHGLGLLGVTAMAITGTVLFVLHGTPAAHIALGLHKLIANLIWAYLVVHAGSALLHQAVGGDVLGRMFWSRRPRPARMWTQWPTSTRE